MRFASSARPSRYSASADVLPELVPPGLVTAWALVSAGGRSDLGFGCALHGRRGRRAGHQRRCNRRRCNRRLCNSRGGRLLGTVGTGRRNSGIVRVDLGATGAVCVTGATLGTDVGAAGAAWATLAGATCAAGTVGVAGTTLGTDVGATGAGATLGAAAATLGRAGAILGGGGSAVGGGSPGCTAAVGGDGRTTCGFHSLAACVAAGIVAAGFFSARPANFPGGHEAPRRTSASPASGGPSPTFCVGASSRDQPAGEQQDYDDAGNDRRLDESTCERAVGEAGERVDGDSRQDHQRHEDDDLGNRRPPRSTCCFATPTCCFTTRERKQARFFLQLCAPETTASPDPARTRGRAQDSGHPLARSIRLPNCSPCAHMSGSQVAIRGARRARCMRTRSTSILNARSTRRRRAVLHPRRSRGGDTLVGEGGAGREDRWSRVT